MTRRNLYISHHVSQIKHNLYHQNIEFSAFLVLIRFKSNYSPQTFSFLISHSFLDGEARALPKKPPLASEKGVKNVDSHRRIVYILAVVVISYI